MKSPSLSIFQHQSHSKTKRRVLSFLYVSLALLVSDAALAQNPDESRKAANALEEHLKNGLLDCKALEQQSFANTALTKEDANKARNLLAKAHFKKLRNTRKTEFDKKEIVIDEFKLRYDYKVFGNKPKEGRSLFISMHGGGGTAPKVNDRQWENQKRLYKPKEGVYVAPRAPSDTWNLWHRSHIDGLFDQLIADMVVFENVNPNRVYLTGYSAGGDGVFQLAPRMADRWAAAAMMAGHPNDASPVNLRNIGFTIHMGGKDKAYNRNKVAREWKEKLAELQKNDPNGYVHQVVIHEDKGHWMDREDAVAIPWMSKFTRNVFPKTIVWRLSKVTHNRFYWLHVDDAHYKKKARIDAKIDRSKIAIRSDDVHQLDVLLTDELVNLDEPLKIVFNEYTAFTGKATRTIAALSRSLRERQDTAMMCPVRVSVADKP